jgi:hypothetical protein
MQHILQDELYAEGASGRYCIAAKKRYRRFEAKLGGCRGRLGKDTGLYGHPRASFFENSPENQEKWWYCPLSQ